MITASSMDFVEAYVISHATENIPVGAVRISRETGITLNDVQGIVRKLVDDKVLDVKKCGNEDCYHSSDHRKASAKPEQKDDDDDEDPDAYVLDDEHIQAQGTKEEPFGHGEDLVSKPKAEDGFKTRCGAILPSLRGQHIHEGLCHKCKALLSAKEKSAVGLSHFKECRFGCGKKLAPQGVWRHELYCPKRPKDPVETLDDVRKVAEAEVKAYKTISNLGDSVTHTWQAPGILCGTAPFVAPKPTKRYKLDIHCNDIIIDKDKLQIWIEDLLEHGVKEITIKEVG